MSIKSAYQRLEAFYKRMDASIELNKQKLNEMVELGVAGFTDTIEQNKDLVKTEADLVVGDFKKFDEYMEEKLKSSMWQDRTIAMKTYQIFKNKLQSLWDEANLLRKATIDTGNAIENEGGLKSHITDSEQA